jgi:hypothetical protein
LSIFRSYKADILLLKHDRRIYIDVTVTRPTNNSNQKLPLITSTPLLSTRARESSKHSKYAAIAEKNEYEMVAFVLESYGGINDEATSLLATLASHASEGDQQSFLLFAHQSLSVALQNSNAFIAQIGTQMMHTEEQRLGGLAQSQIKYRAKLQAQAAALDAEQADSLPFTARRRQFSQVGLLTPVRATKAARSKSAAAAAGEEQNPTDSAEGAAAPHFTPALIELMRDEPLLPPSSPLLSPLRKKQRIRSPLKAVALAAPAAALHIHPSRLQQLAALFPRTALAAVESPTVLLHAAAESMDDVREAEE